MLEGTNGSLYKIEILLLSKYITRTIKEVFSTTSATIMYYPFYSMAPSNAYGYSQNFVTPFMKEPTSYYGFNTTNVMAYNKGFTEALMSSRGGAYRNFVPHYGGEGEAMLPPVDFESAQKMFEKARKKASTFRRDCYSLYAIEHQNDNSQNETYRHICTSYSQDNLKQFADNHESALFFISSEVVAADGSRYTIDGKTIYDKINYIPQDGFVYHSSAGVLFDVSDFEAVEHEVKNTCDNNDDDNEFEHILNTKTIVSDEIDELSLSFFSEDSENTKTLADLTSLCDETQNSLGLKGDFVPLIEDKRDFAEMAKNRKSITELHNNTINAYQTVKLNEFFGKAFTRGTSSPFNPQ